LVKVANNPFVITAADITVRRVSQAASLGIAAAEHFLNHVQLVIDL